MALRRPDRYRPKYGRRSFALDLSDHVAGIWDESIPIVQQVALECVGVPSDRLNAAAIRSLMEVVIQHFSLHIVGQLHVQQFGNSGGVTAFAILSESHIAAHTWPEKGYLHLDLVTCSRHSVETQLLSDVVGHTLLPTSIRINHVSY